MVEQSDEYGTPYDKKNKKDTDDLFFFLDKYGVNYDKKDVEDRFKLVIQGLRRSPTFETNLENYKRQSGGAEDTDAIPIPVRPEKDDFLGPQIKWVVEGLSSPQAQSVIRVLFTVLFFVSYLESLPDFGAILSVALDVMTAGGSILIKTVQKAIPPLFGLIPLPFMNLVGIGMASIFGMIFWPLVAIVSFSRQEFTTAIQAFMRVIPPPIGDAIADTFLDVNRTVSKLNEKREKLVEQITKGLQGLVETEDTVVGKAAQGAKTLISRTQEAAQQAKNKIRNNSPEFTEGVGNLMNRAKSSIASVRDSNLTQNITEQARRAQETARKMASRGSIGGYRFSRKQRTKNKWKTQRKLQKK